MTSRTTARYVYQVGLHCYRWVQRHYWHMLWYTNSSNQLPIAEGKLRSAGQSNTTIKKLEISNLVETFSNYMLATSNN